MKISKIVEHVNRIVGKGNHSFHDLSGYFDECIDAINSDLNVALPLLSEVYEYASGAAFTLTQDEIDNYTFEDDSEDNEYTRLPAAYIRNYLTYEAAYRILRDEDEDDEVLMPKALHARKWYTKLIAVFNDYSLEDSEAISIGGDADEVLGETAVDDTGVGFYNPYFEYDD